MRDPFPDNMLPQSLLDPVGQRVAALYPEPNAAGDSLTNSRNFSKAGKFVPTNDRVDVRIDWARNEKHTLYGRFTKARQDLVGPTFFGNGADFIFASNPTRGS